MKCGAGINQADALATSTIAGFCESGAVPTGIIQNTQVNYYGSTYDRNRNNYTSTTRDSGTQSSSGNGATPTNYNAESATITGLVGTVVGSGTLAFQLQWSIDGGTTWLNLSGVATALTTSGQTASFVCRSGIGYGSDYWCY